MAGDLGPHEDAIVELMTRIEPLGIRWDRCMIDVSSFKVYGWISREHRRADFVLLDFAWTEDRFGVGFSTSSATHSAGISEALYGTTEEGAHVDCTRVEEVLGGRVNAIVLDGEACPQCGLNDKTDPRKHPRYRWWCRRCQRFFGERDAGGK